MDLRQTTNMTVNCIVTITICVCMSYYVIMMSGKMLLFTPAGVVRGKCIKKRRTVNHGMIPATTCCDCDIGQIRSIGKERSEVELDAKLSAVLFRYVD